MYHVRRTEREIRDHGELERMLTQSRFATLALCRGEEPYVVTLTHAYDNERRCLYFHAALEGQKLDFVRANPQACATVVEDHGYVPGECSHRYRSVVLRGPLTIIADPHEMVHAMKVLIGQHEAEPEPVSRRFLPDSTWTAGVVMLRMDISEITGKGNC